MSLVRERPQPTEYADYYSMYVDLVPDGDVVDVLRAGLDDALALLGGIDEGRGDHRYAPGKWSIKEVVGHVIDCERVFAYRAMRFARGDATELPGIDQDPLVAGARFDRRTLASLARELEGLRRANLELFASFGDEELARGGRASGFDITVRALLHVAAGHAIHHVGVLRERYLG